MWKQMSVAGVLVAGVVAGSYALTRHSGSQSVSTSEETTSPGAVARKWLQEHGYQDEKVRPERHGRRVAAQP
jgi:hypothetical protein